MGDRRYWLLIRGAAEFMTPTSRRGKNTRKEPNPQVEKTKEADRAREKEKRTDERKEWKGGAERERAKTFREPVVW